MKFPTYERAQEIIREYERPDGYVFLREGETIEMIDRLMALHRANKCPCSAHDSAPADVPAFEIRQADGKTIEIFADGRVRGLSGVIVNRIPILIERARAEILRGA